MKNVIRPLEVTLDKKRGVLEIQWADDSRAQYPLPQLREACPCAECRGGHEFMGMAFAPKDLLTLTPKRSYAMQDLLPVGNYALQPVWDDGHSSGIYTWEYLHYIAPKGQRDGDPG
jgi:DUF971 family protein